jgi:predicted glutamine amidotransferase
MRYALVDHVRPELAQYIEGTTDSEWIYALVLSQLDDPWRAPETHELVEATLAALRILRRVRAAHGIDTSSPVNLCLSTGRAVVATRFSFDYGWYPPDDEFLEVDLPFVSLWYAIGGAYVESGGSWEMTAAETPRSLIIASEPLTSDHSSWLEVPEYTLLTAELDSDNAIEFEARDLDV